LAGLGTENVCYAEDYQIAKRLLPWKQGSEKPPEVIPYMKAIFLNEIRIELRRGLAFLAVCTLTLSRLGAADLNVSGNLEVTGDADIQGNQLSFGTSEDGGSLPGITFSYSDAVTSGTATIPSILKFSATGNWHQWLWERENSESSTTIPMMKLGPDHVLTIYDVFGNPAITLDPSGSSDSSASVLTQGMADQRYIVNGGTSAVTLSNATVAGTFSISGSATMNGSPVLSQSAADSRYLPSSSGISLLNGRVGIGTTAPSQSLHIKGLSPRVKIESTSSTLASVLEMGGLNATNYLFVNPTDGGWYFRTDSPSRHVYIQAIGLNSGGANQGRVQIGGVGTIPPPPESQLVIRGNTNSATFGLLDAQSYSGTSAFYVRSDGRVGINTTSPEASLDVKGDGRISGNLTVSGSGSLTLPNGIVLSSSNTLQGIVASGTAASISGTIPASQVSGLSTVATSGAYSALSGLPAIPTNTNELVNGAGFITSSGTTAHAVTSGTASALSGTLPAAQVSGLSAVATTGDYSSLSGLPIIPTNTSALVNDAGFVTASGTTNGITLSGTSNASGKVVVSGGMVVTGTTVSVTTGTTTVTKIVSSGSNHLILIPEQGDLSMGQFTAGPIPQ